jgi:endonuclease YncB( thermonuclease family)
MAVGLLEVQGTIDVAQFWPAGTSDADTTKVLVGVEDGAFQFRPSDSVPFKPTKFYEGAKVKGRSGSKPPLNKNNQITIRLQGIDAPELHYRPSPLTSAERNGASATALSQFRSLDHFYRQPLGATTTNALHEFLLEMGQSTISCSVWTQVDYPNEVFDTYGRLVGDIEIATGGKTIDLNHWLVEQGWAFPTFYSSMSNAEITAIVALGKSAKSNKRGIWKHVSKIVRAFDFALLQPKKGDTTVLATDKGWVLFPKLFRRQCSWAARKKAAVTKHAFQHYLIASQDDCFKTSEFLAHGIHSAKPHVLSSFVKAGKTIAFEPDGLVFQEAASNLIGPDGKQVQHF